MNTVSIFFKAVIEGYGIVNFDSNDQKFNWNRVKGAPHINTSNVSIGKAVYSQVSGDDGEPVVVRTPKISADCLRHAMWEEEMPNMMPNIMLDTDLLLGVLASPALLERGYMYTKEDAGTFVRKSPVRFTPAKVSKPTIPMLETHSTSSPKEENLDDSKSANSFFAKETRGEERYLLEGVIDVTELAFISLSDLHGRMAFPPDHVEKYRELLGRRLGSDIAKPKYFDKKFDLFNIPEYGIMLTNQQVSVLVRDILRRLCTINIQRTTTGYARVSEVQIKEVRNPLEDLFFDEDGWTTIKETGKSPTLDVIDGMSFECRYVAALDGEARIQSFNELREAEKDASTEKNKKKKEDQEARAAKKKAAKKVAKKA